MVEDKAIMIREKIEPYLVDKDKKFVIFPYGYNGMLTHRIMQEQFGISPILICDNGLNKYNDKIKSSEALEEFKDGNVYIILTIENPYFYPEIRMSAEKYFCADRIIDLFENSADGRIRWIMDFSRFVYDSKMGGSVAECGVYRGECARYINMFFDDKKCYLFDTFEGFPKDDLNIDVRDNPYSTFWKKDLIQSFSNTSEQYVMSIMPFPQNVEIKKGYVPDTFEGIDDMFCFVNLDMDLYKPMLDALLFFYPRMVSGGIILLHDYYRSDLRGVKKAVCRFEELIDESIIKIPLRLEGGIGIVKR